MRFVLLAVACATAPAGPAVTRGASSAVAVKVLVSGRAVDAIARLNEVTVAAADQEPVHAVVLSVYEPSTALFWWSVARSSTLPDLDEVAATYVREFAFAATNDQIVGFRTLGRTLIVRASRKHAAAADAGEIDVIAHSVGAEIVAIPRMVQKSPGDTAVIDLLTGLGPAFTMGPLHDPGWTLQVVRAQYDKTWRIDIQNGRGEIGTIVLDDAFGLVKTVKQ